MQFGAGGGRAICVVCVQVFVVTHNHFWLVVVHVNIAVIRLSAAPYGLELYGQLRHLLALVDRNGFKTAHSAEVDDPELGLAPALATALLLTQA
ncbi:hypothetical protein OGATHE_005357 [Ogataea polymorpha]|uniref:Uncharacterized protein n=1 Tax=Ogataea polymorpha TaxID=460523 RepID=A0A9P8T0M6_9ASCO|nr:hypothetical protein OGATHE_005357 [Ogataea polymorpha]